MSTCEQTRRNGERCGSSAAFRFTWPGYSEQLICDLHAMKARAVAKAMGMPLILFPINPEIPETWREDLVIKDALGRGRR